MVVADSQMMMVLVRMVVLVEDLVQILRVEQQVPVILPQQLLLKEIIVDHRLDPYQDQEVVVMVLLVLMVKLEDLI